MTDHIETIPHMGASDADSWRYRGVPADVLSAQADRIAALDAAIWESPEAYLDAVAYMGGITLGKGDEHPDTYTHAPADVPQRLQSFLESDDDTRVEFDEASDEAIFDDSEVRRRLAYNKSKLDVRHRSSGHGQSTTEDHPEAANFLNQLSLYKLYLYIGRVRAYKAQTAADGKGRDQSAA